MKLTIGQMNRLHQVAKFASEKAYCPYSKFKVGAAVLSADKQIYAGCNVENASYGLTICAERNAVFRAVTAGVKEIIAVAIYTPTPTPSASCGACRQVLLEFGPDARVMSFCDGDDVLMSTVSAWLPQAFRPENL